MNYCEVNEWKLLMDWQTDMQADRQTDKYIVQKYSLSSSKRAN
jgi:hypothetical protein